MPPTEADKAYATVIARAARDPAFRAQLIADPRSVLMEAGLAVPDGVEVKCLEDTADCVHLAIPRPSAVLADADLDRIAGGSGEKINWPNWWGPPSPFPQI